MSNEAFRYGIRKRIQVPFAEAEERVREELQKEGFGILTEIDVKATLKTKLDEDFRPYKILGACNPPLAHQALKSETEIGLLLPCNVILYEGDRPEETVVAIVDPVVQLGVTGREDITPLATAVREKLQEALNRL